MLSFFRTLTLAALLFRALAAPQSVRADLMDEIAKCPPDACLIQLQPGQKYIETRAWDLRNRKNVNIVGSGQAVQFIFPEKETPKVAIDATGAVGLRFEGWTFAIANASTKPDVGLLLARKPDNAGAGSHHFERWRVQGWFKTAAIVAIASEVNVWDHCWLSNSHPESIVYWTGRFNELGLTSQFGPIGEGSTNTCHDFFATGFGHYGMVFGSNDTSAAVVVAAGTHDFHVRGGTMSMRGRESQGNTGGRAAIHIGTPGGKPAINILLDAVEWETVGARNAILVAGRVDGLTVRNALLQSTEAILKIEPKGAIFDSTIESNRMIGRIAKYELARKDDAIASIEGKMIGCRLDLRARTLINLKRDSKDVSSGCDAAIFISPQAELEGNEIHVRKKTDIAGKNDLTPKNKIHAWEE